MMNDTTKQSLRAMEAALADMPQNDADSPQLDVPRLAIAVAEPAPSTQEMSVAHAKSYAQPMPRPTGAAAAECPPQIPLAPIKRVRAQFNPLADGMLYLVVFLGGCLGTAMRYGMSLLFPRPAAEQGVLSAFHIATFCSNMLACFIFAMLTEYMSQASWIRKRARQLTSRGVGMGMCGGFSTLSAMMVEELSAIHDGQIAGLLWYTLASFLCGLVVAMFGVRIAGRLASMHRVRAARVMQAAQAESDAGTGVPSLAHVAQSDGFASSQAEGDVGAPEVNATVPAPDAGMVAAMVADTVSGNVAPPSFEPDPITDEIALVGDFSTGEVGEIRDSRDEPSMAHAAAAVRHEG